MQTTLKAVPAVDLATLFTEEEGIKKLEVKLEKHFNANPHTVDLVTALARRLAHGWPIQWVYRACAQLSHRKVIKSRPVGDGSIVIVGPLIQKT